MPCCVGMTTEPKAGKAKWQAVYKNLRGYKMIAGPFSYRSDAEEAWNKWAEDMKAEKHICTENPPLNSEWWVYYFKHDGEL